jgi:hypothetical protein
MRSRPILFSAPMVRALLAGTKTQTRRVVKARADKDMGPRCVLQPHEIAGEVNGGNYRNSVHGEPGDRLWVRETWAVPHRYDHLGPSNIPPLDVRTHYAASEERGGLRWRPSIHMCRWASRITLEVTGVRVERLQDISQADALAEGIVQTHGGYGLPAGEHFHAADQRESYLSLWEAINGTGSVQANPWVWVLEFRRLEGAA